MVIKVYVSMITFTQEVKKNQQRALMILESKNIPFVTIDITDPGCEDSKDYMNENAKPKGNNKIPMTPQIFNDAEYCGDFEDLDMANETDSLGEFLKLTEEEKKTIKIGITSLLPEERAKQQESEKMTNGVPASRETEANEVPAATETTAEDEGLREADVIEVANKDAAEEGKTEENVEGEAMGDGEVKEVEAEVEEKGEEEAGANEEENAEDEVEEEAEEEDADPSAKVKEDEEEEVEEAEA